MVTGKADHVVDAVRKWEGGICPEVCGPGGYDFCGVWNDCSTDCTRVADTRRAKKGCESDCDTGKYEKSDYSCVKECLSEICEDRRRNDWKSPHKEKEKWKEEEREKWKHRDEEKRDLRPVPLRSSMRFGNPNSYYEKYDSKLPKGDALTDLLVRNSQDNQQYLAQAGNNTGQTDKPAEQPPPIELPKVGPDDIKASKNYGKPQIKPDDGTGIPYSGTKTHKYDPVNCGYNDLSLPNTATYIGGHFESCD